MEFHIEAADGLGPGAIWAAPADYTDNLVRSTSTQRTACKSIHITTPVHVTDKVLRGSGAIYPRQVADCLAVRGSTKTLWEFSDGQHVYKVRIAQWDMFPLGGGVYRLEFELKVEKQLK